MAVPGDFLYLDYLLDNGMLDGEILELGSYNRQQIDLGNARTTIERRGLTWQGADIDAGPGVDFTLDVLDDSATAAIGRRWDSILVMNLLEHVYDPIRALANAVTLAKPGGQVVVVGPAVWQLHDFPRDFWRPMPDFYVEFAGRHGCTVPAAGMRWIVLDKLMSVSALTVGDQKELPSLHNAESVFGFRRARWSRILHRAGNTFGREMFFPYVGLGVCLDVSPAERKLS